MTHEQAPVVAQPGEGAFDFPAFAVAAQGACVVALGQATPSAMWADKKDAALQQTPTQEVAVVGAIGDHPQRTRLRSAASTTRYADLSKRGLCQSHFRRLRGSQLASQRNTLAVCHHHPLCAFAFAGLADREAPFFAGAKLASRKLSLQSSLPRWSSSERKLRQIPNQTSPSSHRRRRRQQVLGEGYSLGRSRQRAPLLSTHKMPSNTARLSAQGLPLLRSLGSSGSRCFHCFSLSNLCSIPSFSSRPPQIVQTNLRSSHGSYETTSMQFWR